MLVTGGSRGIGLAVARMFQQGGERVAVVHRGSGHAPENTLGIECDVTDSRQVDRAFREASERHGPVEVLVVNAGIIDDHLVMGMRDEQFHRVIETNLYGAFYAARCAYPSMVRMGRGRIILVSSVSQASEARRGRPTTPRARQVSSASPVLSRGSWVLAASR